MSSCSLLDKDDEKKVQHISFVAHIASPTRATDIEFEEGDQISLFATEEDVIGSNNYAQNVPYTYFDGLFTTNGTLSYPTDESVLNFYAVYPFGDYTTPDFTFNVETNQTTHAAYTASDLMTATAVGKNEEIVDLTFSHRLSKIVVNFKADPMPVGEQSMVVKNVYYTAEADLASNSFSHTGSVADIQACPNGTNSFKVILPPQAIKKGEVFLEIKIGDKTYTWKTDRDMVFNSGVEYTYSVELKNNVVFTTQINPWNTPEVIEAVIPDEYLDLIGDYIPIHKGVNPPNVEGTYFISPDVLAYDSDDDFSVGYQFADNYVQFYDQTSDNTISMKATQLLGDLLVGEGMFISGEGNDFTIYFNSYSTHEDGSWLVEAEVISGTINGNTIENFTQAFIILDDYDVNGKYMDTGDYRVLEDGDGISEQTTWPLDATRAPKKSGNSVSRFASKK